ncbi:MAG: 50S ribosomal protein L9 [Acidimicrobiaceae bacterium]|nr:50S ribosomal protein L9 [Acidimicrobiaceae bacterium]
MRVVLRSDRAGLGKRGDIVEVADGFARNFLLPKGQAIVASDGIVNQAQAMRNSRDARETRLRGSASELAVVLEALAIRIEARAQEGRLFGSVAQHDIVEAISAAGGPTIERRRVEMEEHIKTTGSHDVKVRLHSEVMATVHVEVVGVE